MNDLFVLSGSFPQWAVMVPIVEITCEAELLAYEAERLSEGYEGIMIRDPRGPYKFGRSTEREGYLLKVKRFEDSEARIVGYEEQMHNENVAEKDAFGRTKRSSAKAGKVAAGTLGKILAEDIHDLFPGVELKIGTGEGLTLALRNAIWANKGAYLGKIVKYKYQKIGTKDAPRSPIMLGFRDPSDIGGDK